MRSREDEALLRAFEQFEREEMRRPEPGRAVSRYGIASLAADDEDDAAEDEAAE